MANEANNKRREQRLAQQLRANLMRRKQQARHRQDAETENVQDAEIDNVQEAETKNVQESAKESSLSAQHVGKSKLS